VVGQPHDRVADQLAGAVEGDLAAAVDVDDLGGAGVERALVRVRALAAGEHRWVLEQQDGLLTTLGDVGVDLALEVPGPAVVHRPETAMLDHAHPVEGSPRVRTACGRRLRPSHRFGHAGRVPVRVPLALLVLAAGLTLGLVGLEVVARVPAPDRPSAPAPSSRTAPAPGERFALEVLHAWDRRRASAWAAGDPVALATLYVPASSAGAADVALLRRYAARGLVVRDLRMQVLRARVLVTRPRRVTLEVTDRLAGARAVRVDRTDAARRLPADTASTRILELRRVGGRWLMARVSSSPSAGGR
jgi:hypothetical protein